MTNNKLEIEKRYIECRSRENTETTNNTNQMKIKGTAVVFESPTVLYEVDGVEFKEVIDRHALDNADFSLCCLKYNHENCVPVLARTRKGSLRLNIDDVGLHFEADLFNTSTSRDVYTLIQEGGLDKCSFAFTVKSSEYDKVNHLRRITEIDKVFDVSIVDTPAYEDTSVELRSFFDMEIAKEKQTLENEINKRKRLELLTI